LDEFASQKDLIFFLDMKDADAVGPTLDLIKEKKIEDRFDITLLTIAFKQDL